jgi:hypothetical protein
VFKGYDEGALPGLSDLVPPTGRKPTPAKVEECTQAIRQADLPLEPTMGFGDWRGFIGNCRSRSVLFHGSNATFPPRVQRPFGPMAQWRATAA